LNIFIPFTALVPASLIVKDPIERKDLAIELDYNKQITHRDTKR
jgi:hypothetical protein